MYLLLNQRVSAEKSQRGKSFSRNFPMKTPKGPDGGSCQCSRKMQAAWVRHGGCVSHLSGTIPRRPSLVLPQCLLMDLYLIYYQFSSKSTGQWADSALVSWPGASRPESLVRRHGGALCSFRCRCSLTPYWNISSLASKLPCPTDTHS